MKSVDAIGSFVGIDTGGDAFDVVDPDEKRERENQREGGADLESGFASRCHCIFVFVLLQRECFLFFVLHMVELWIWIGIRNSLLVYIIAKEA